MTRQIFLDTETTGISYKQGNRLIEIGCLEAVDRQLTGQQFHYYINPERDNEEGAFRVHGLSREFLSDKPVFKAVAQAFVDFVSGAELIIHNAPFDTGFLNNELKIASSNYPELEEICEIEDSLTIARNKFPGQRNSLDALANRFNVSGYDRTFHGALLDANILADVYMQLTGGQSKFEFISNGESVQEKNKNSENINNIDRIDNLPKITLSKSEIVEHEKRIGEIEKKHSLEALWRKFQ